MEITDSSFLICLCCVGCVCECTIAHRRMCSVVCACVWVCIPCMTVESREDLRCFPLLFPILLPWEGSILNWQLALSERLNIQQVLQGLLPFLHTEILGINSHAQLLFLCNFYMNLGDLNSGPYTSQANGLFCFILFYLLSHLPSPCDMYFNQIWCWKIFHLWQALFSLISLPSC